MMLKRLSISSGPSVLDAATAVCLYALGPVVACKPVEKLVAPSGVAAVPAAGGLELGREREPNDLPLLAPEFEVEIATSPLTAASWGSGGAVLRRYRAHGELASGADVDCFQMRCLAPPEGSRARFELHARTPWATAVQVSGIEADDREPVAELLLQIAGEPGATAIVPDVGCRSWAPYLVACVSAPTLSTATPLGYELVALEWAPNRPTEFEPNNNSRVASALPLDAGVEGYLAAGDEDWYQLQVAAGRPRVVSVSGPASLGLKLALFDAATKPVEPVDNATEPLAVPPHAAFLRVTGAGADPGQPYCLSLRILSPAQAVHP